MPPQTIDDVITALTEIVTRSRREPSRLGYFAVLYRTVTLEVKEGIAAGRFENGSQMEILDVIFANRYLHALEQFQNGGQPSKCWLVAFESAGNWRPLILQHLLLGINAHINLDLGIAAAQTCPGAALPSLQRDFEEINKILMGLLDGVQRKIGRHSPWLALLDRVGGKTDEAVVNFSMKKARTAAWKVAQKLAPLDTAQQQEPITALDLKIEKLARKILNPGWFAQLVGFVIRFRESDDIPAVIDTLAEAE